MAPSQYKDLSGYVDFPYKDKTVVRLSNLYNRNPYTGKTISLYQDAPFVPCGNQSEGKKQQGFFFHKYLLITSYQESDSEGCC